MGDVSEPVEQRYWVPRHIRACVTGSGAVLLNLKRNRYSGLGVTEIRSLSALAQNWAEVSIVTGTTVKPMSPDQAVRFAAALMSAGLLTDQPPTDEPLALSSVRSDAALTSVGFEMQRPTRIRIRDVIAFARACVWAKRAVDSRLLYSIAREVEQFKRCSPDPPGVARAVELVCIFRRLRPYAFSAKDQCLFHALALLKFLALSGIVPTWVVAVRPIPWAAHSWLQLNDLVLDCNPEEICGYTPILAI
ncbi:MAG: lasso peptide biosynthesis B2 protein [Steroidobacteraceae bacterium]